MIRRLITSGYILLGCSLASLSYAQELTIHQQHYVGEQPRSVVSADFNGDLIPDFATANFGDATVSVVLSDGIGGYLNASSYPSAGNNPAATPIPMTIVSANFDGINGPDLLVINQDETVANLLVNNGTGTFSSASIFDIGSTPVHVVVGQFNATADSFPDIVVVNKDTAVLGAAPSVQLFLNNGAGIFTQNGTHEVGQSPEYAITGDFNGDTHPDLIVANNRAQSLSFLAGDGLGNFDPAVNTTLEFRPPKLSSGDFNNDGHLDIIVLRIYEDRFTYLPGRGDGTFITDKGVGDFLGKDAKTLLIGHTPTSIVNHDFNGDNNLDIAIGHSDSHNLLIIQGQGDGSFRLDENYYAVGAGPVDLVIADINKDTHQDIISANIDSNTISTILSNTDGSLHTLKLRPINTDFHRIISADFNGDTLPDLATINANSTDVEIKIRKYGQTFEPTSFVNLPFVPEFISAGDIDGNIDGSSGTDDLLAHDGLTKYASLLANADGSFQTRVNGLIAAVGSELAQMHSADFNADNRSDLIIVNTGTKAITYLESNGDQVTEITEYPVGELEYKDPDGTPITVTNKPTRLIVNDFNKDDMPDVITLNPESRTVTQLLSTPQPDIIIVNDDGTQQTEEVPSIPLDEVHTPPVIPYPIHAINSIDYNLDLLPDLLLTRSDAHTYMLLVSNIDGSFDPSVTYDIDLSPLSLTTGNFNDDGIPDIAALTIIDKSATILTLLGNGDGSFRPGIKQKLGPYSAQALISTKLDDDQFTDLVVATSRSTLQFLINDGEGRFNSPSAPKSSGSEMSNLLVVENPAQGLKQIIASNDTKNSSVVYTDQGGGAYSPLSRTPVTGINSTGLAARDMNSDGILDLISISSEANEVSILKGENLGTYASRNEYATGEGPIALAVQDFDNDRFYDVATADAASQTISIIKGIDATTTEPGMLDVSQTTTIDLLVGSPAVKATPVHMISTDINQDGLFDLAVLLKEPAALQIYMNQGGMIFTPLEHPIPVGPEPKYIHTEDVNLDGGTDFVIVARQISVILNEGKFMPDPFVIHPVVGQLTNSQATSAPIAITGIPNGSARVQIINGSYSLDGVHFTTREGAVHNFDAIHVRTNTAASAATPTTATLIVGGYSDEFSATTIADGTRPGEFSFTEVLNAPRSRLDAADETETTIKSTFTKSNEVTITGLTQATPISISREIILLGKPDPTTEVEVEAQYSINGQEFTSEPGLINNNDTLVIQLAGSILYETKTYARITIGGVSTDFTVTTQPDTEPNRFYLPDRLDLLPKRIVFSPWITVTGITAPTSISIKNGHYDIDSQNSKYTNEESTITNGRKFRIRAVSPSTYDTPLDITITVGGIDSVFTIRTRKNPNVAAAERQAELTDTIKEQPLFGCSLSANRNNGFDPTLPALVIASLVVLWRRRKTLH